MLKVDRKSPRRPSDRASGDGQAAPRTGEPMIDIFANVRLSTASEEYAWVNERQIWSVGTGDLATGKIRVTAHMQ
jgi:hypothetical protein